MRRNCNLELHHPSADSRFPNPNENQQQEQQQRLTIFYDGMVCVRDVTELQARSILFLANKEMEERVKSSFTPPSGSAEPTSPKVMSLLYSPVAGMSMKRSLQRFLQQRKHRTRAISPYHH